MITTDQLAAIQARADAAFPAPWKAWDRGIGYEVHSHYDEPLNFNCRETFTRADAEFISHARTDIPTLLAMVRERDAAIERVEVLCKAGEARQTAKPYVFAGAIRAALTATDGAE